MKKLVLFLTFVLSVNLAWSQGETPKVDRNFRIPLIGERAPSFRAESTTGTINFPSDFGRNWKILFSHPQDFTPVCTTEIIELAYLQDQFEKAGVKLAVVSISSLDIHKEWKLSMEGLSLNGRPPVKINFPLVDDQNLSISKKYGMIHPESNTTKDVRGVFVIDPNNIIQAIYFYPMSVGRNTDELLRVISALQVTTAEKVSTPVNWRPGNDLLVPVNPRQNMKDTVALPSGYYSPIWYLTYKKANK